MSESRLVRARVDGWMIENDDGALVARIAKLEAELAAARAVIEAAEAMRDYLTVESFMDPKRRVNVTAFDAALAEWRKVQG